MFSFAGLYYISLYNYLLFHTLIEGFTIVVACCIFVIAWNSRKFAENSYLLFLGIAYLFIAGMDAIHTLSYTGMGLFLGYDSNLPTQLWIIARYMESFSFLVAAVFIKRNINPGLTFAGYSIISIILLASIFQFNIFPDCFIEGVGLTTFKVLSEYTISLILLFSAIILFKNKNEFDPKVSNLILIAIMLTILTELTFTFYIDVYGFSNMVGHFLKLASFILIYQAIVITGISQPYNLIFRDLQKNEKKLKEENELKDLFTDILRHDLLNPANVIKGYTDILLENEKNENNLKILKIIKKIMKKQ